MKYIQSVIGLPLLKLKFIFLFIIVLVISSDSFGQTKTVTGIVRNEKGELLPGVSVTVKNSDVGTSTGGDGRYSVQMPAGKNTLVFSIVGYDSKELSTTGLTTLDVQLQTKVSELGDVVVVAYGTQKKATLSGAVASVKGEEIAKSPAINVSNSLAGRVPGLTVVGQGGEPGNDFSRIYVRGINTFRDATPLFVVDGIPLQASDKLERIDPSVIESITVMKDASAAIYGSLAANGVILITTKRGKAGRVSATASFNQGFSQPTRLPDLLSSAEIAVLHNEAIDYGYGGTPLPHSQKFTAAEIQKFKDGSDPWRYPNTDWLKEVLKNWSIQNYANLSLSGGSEKIRALVSLSTRYQDGFYKHSAGDYHQHDVRANLDMNPNEYILFSLDLNGRLEDRNFPTGNTGAIFHQLIGTSPTRHAYWPNGVLGEVTDPTSGSSPAATSTPLAGYNQGKNYVLNATAKLNFIVPWIQGLSFTSSATIDRTLRFGKYWSIPIAYNKWDQISVDSNNIPVLQPDIQGVTRQLAQSNNNNYNFLVNLLANYERKFNVHGLKFLVGIEQMEQKSDFFNVLRRGFDANNLDQLVFGATTGDVINGAASGANRWQNYFGRVNYDYKSKYLAEFVWRYQGSSKFSPDTRWGFFPGASIGYRISEEKFWKGNLSKINSFKIRASWGKTGNDLIPPYQYLSLYNIVGYSNYPFHYVSQVGPAGQLIHETVLNEGVAPYNSTWEEADQKDIGFDAEFFNSRLNVTVDYFNNSRSKILSRPIAAIPTSTGIQPSDQNIGKFKNTGFDFNIVFKNSGSKLSYQVGLNGLYAKNKILFFDETPGVPAYQQVTGHPIGAGLYYEVIGIYKSAADVAKFPAYRTADQPGDLIFKDTNGDGVIDSKDQVRSYKSSVPVFSGGLNFDFQYGNFDLSILFQGAAGSERYLRPTFSIGGNYLQAFYDKRWTPDNPNASYPRLFSGSSPDWVDPNAVYNTFFVKKTDYVRLKNIEFGYNLPGSLLQKFHIPKLRIYVSALNLFTYCPALKDWGTDPEEEIRDQFFGESYPLQRIINVGATANF